MPAGLTVIGTKSKKFASGSLEVVVNGTIFIP